MGGKVEALLKAQYPEMACTEVRREPRGIEACPGSDAE